LAWLGYLKSPSCWPETWHGSLVAEILNIWYCTVGKKIKFVTSAQHGIFTAVSMSAWVPEHDKCQLKASKKLTDAVNISEPGLKSHKLARDLAITESESTRTSTSASATKKTSTSTLPATTTTMTSQSTSIKRKQSASVQDVDDEAEDSQTVPEGTH